MPVYRDKAKGRFVFEFDHYIGGRRVRTRKSLPKAWDRKQAEEYARRQESALYAAAAGLQRGEATIEAAITRYVLERCPQLKHGKNAALEIQSMQKFYAGRLLSELPAVCREYAAAHATTLAAATVKNRIRYLTAACRYAWRHHGMCENDPAAKVIVPKVANQRKIFIDRAQMLRLARACPHRAARAAIRIAFYSGMREGEIRRAVVRDGAFHLADTKNGEPRIVPIHPKILCCVRYTIPTRYIVAYHFRAARAKIGMDHLHFHDLRHSAASAMINEGVELYTVGAVLGHKSAASTRRYAHLATERLREAIGKIGRRAA